MAHHGRHSRSTPQVHERPEHPQHAGGDARVSTLEQVPRAKRDARHDQADASGGAPHAVGRIGEAHSVGIGACGESISDVTCDDL